MNLEKYTQKLQEAILAAQRLAQDLNHQNIEPAHLLQALLRQDQGVVPAIVTKVSGSPQALLQEIQSELGKRPKIGGLIWTLAFRGRLRTCFRLRSVM